MTNKISVIVTCYNHGQYIEQCLRSIFSQTYQTIDLLVINDGSNDNSDAVITSVLQDSPFEQTDYIIQENSGICVTRNRGLDWLSDDSGFVLFVDSDNYLDGDYIERLLAVATREAADIVYANLVDVETGTIVTKARAYDFEAHLKGNFIDNCSLIRIAKIGNARYDLALNRKKLVDYDFFLNLIINNDAKPYPAADVNLNYRVLENSISDRSGDVSRYFDAYVYMMLKYAGVIPDAVHHTLKNTLTEYYDLMESRLKAILEKDKHIRNFQANDSYQEDLIAS
ncbi:MAG: glycosyltransferase family 2 protein, partial [Streptococcaceae bacterium]|nr:glycosyltransferase family 2 protein [Streptococcaceae bacterium]